MKQSKTPILILFLAFVLIVVAIIAQMGKNPSRPSPTRQTQETVVKQQNKPEKLNIISTNISSGKAFKINEPIKVKFNKPIDGKTIHIQLKPAISFLPQSNSDATELIVTPENLWNFNQTYTLVILKDTKAADGTSMEKEYRYSFETEPRGGI